jgi:hypothetical protein
MRKIIIAIGIFGVSMVVSGCATSRVQPKIFTFNAVAIEAGLNSVEAAAAEQPLPTNQADSEDPSLTALKPADAIALLEERVTAIRKMVDPNEAGKLAADLSKKQSKWNDTSFYSLIIVGSAGTLLTAFATGPGGAAVAGTLTVIGATIEKMAQNPNRVAQLTACATVEESGKPIIDSFEFEWKLRFSTYPKEKGLPMTVVEKYNTAQKQLHDSIIPLIGKCRTLEK